MPDESPSSLPPSGRVPGASGGNGQYIALAVVLLLLMGGLLIWKLRGDSTSSGQTLVQPTSSTTVARPSLTDAPPPPPDDDTDAGTPDAAPTAKTTAMAGAACGTCSGNAPAALQSDIRAHAGRARRCYERALQQNEQLQGKMTLALKVDSNGNVCSASVSNDSVNSPAVTSCVTGMFRGQHMAAAPTGGCVDVSVPLNFQPQNK